MDLVVAALDVMVGSPAIVTTSLRPTRAARPLKGLLNAILTSSLGGNHLEPDLEHALDDRARVGRSTAGVLFDDRHGDARLVGRRERDEPGVRDFVGVGF